ncbi:MAG: DUF349 domain-containing protein [Nitritalea sp.]
MDQDKELSPEDKVTPTSPEEQGKEQAAQAATESAENQEEQEETEEEETVDYESFSKKQLVEALKELLHEGQFVKNDKQVNEIKNYFDALFQQEKEAAKQAFLAEVGQTEDDFQYRGSDEDRAFYANFNLFKERKSDALKQLEHEKENNLAAKNLLLDRLRDVVDGEETTDNRSVVKEIQEAWKKIGPVPAAHNKNLWASFNALMDRFYDNRSIYFELKELDRKKNLELKLELCEKAEALGAESDIKAAIKTLNEYHEEFKHIGPVPRDEQEPLWQRFKAASDAVYDKRKVFYEAQKEVYEENLAKKEALIESLAPFTSFEGTRIKEWNAKTKEVLAIQKQWEAVGPVPKESGKEINKRFWTAFKLFFSNKNQFFKSLDEVRKENKQRAEELISRAEAMADSTDWQKTTQELIELQQEWKTLGPTPEKVRDELYKRFKQACDSFFEQRRNANKQSNQEFEENLKKKRSLIDEMIAQATAGGATAENMENFIRSFQAIGFVPRKNMKEITSLFNDALENYAAKLGMEGKDKEEFLFRLDMAKLQNDPQGNRIIGKKEHGIRKQIADLENNISLWKNNLAFFASSKTADKLKDQFDAKIQKAEDEIEKLKQRLSILREF